MPEIISTHSHLLTNPQDLETIAESDGLESAEIKLNCKR